MLQTVDAVGHRDAELDLSFSGADVHSAVVTLIFSAASAANGPAAASSSSPALRRAFSAFGPTAKGSIAKARLEDRNVWFDGAWHRTSIWSRLELPAGAVISGPAILEQPDATTVVEPGLVARVDALGNIIIERQST